MEKKYKDSKFKQWLDILQQESWQLELIISGVAIFGLIQAFEPVITAMNRFQALSIEARLVKPIFTLGFLAIITSLFALTLCLIIHIVLRGLWIGAVGLRYFSGDIDYDHLKYTDKFKGYLKKRIGSFDDYIGRLEDYCSIIFATSFLLVFFFLAFFMSLFFLMMVMFTIVSILGDSSTFSSIVGIICVVTLFIAYLLTAIDFFTQGFFKKKKWLGRIYFPIYRVMSRITLSFIYRPLLYNLLDNKLGKRILALLIPLFLVFVIAFFSMDVVESNYHSTEWEDTAFYASELNYEDQFEDEKWNFKIDALIPSKIHKSSALPVFVKHNRHVENAIYYKDSTLVPVKDRRGLDFFAGNGIVIVSDDNNDAITGGQFKRYAQLLDEVLILTIDDTLQFNVPFILSTNSKDQIGYETVLDLDSLSRGLHTLHVKQLWVWRDSLRERSLSRIPFWYYPE